MFRTKKEAWELLALGRATKSAERVSRSKASSFRSRRSTSSPCRGPARVTNDAATQKAYDVLVEKVCPCIVVVHSQGGSFGFNPALTAPSGNAYSPKTPQNRARVRPI